MAKGRILEDAIAAASNRRSFMTKIAVASAGAAAEEWRSCSLSARTSVLFRFQHLLTSLF